MQSNEHAGPNERLSRRHLFRCASAAGALAAAGVTAPSVAAKPAFKPKGRINHSIVQWCYKDYWDIEAMCKKANEFGCKSIELAAPADWPTLKKHGLICAIAGSHLFVQGMNNPRYQPMCLEMMRTSIDQCADAGFPTVITFTGFAQESGDWADGGIPDFEKLPKERRVIDPDEGIRNCVEGYKKIIGYAEKKKINLSIEMLNSRVDVAMKGHPGYQGDHIDYCMEIINQIGSPRLGLLYDVYHVQIMDGDLITRLHECKEAINHVHTAGVPGRRELDGEQEINYEPVMKALVDMGYKGYVGHEFIPTRDPSIGLLEAIQVCDV